MKKFKKFIILAVVMSIFFVPVLSFAQSSVRTCSASINNIGDLICKFGQLLDNLLPVLISLGVIIFVWGVLQYVIGGDEEAKTAGRDRMIYGIIGLVVIVSLWSLVTIVVNTFGLNYTGNQVIDQFVQQNSITNITSSSCSGITSNSKLGDLFSYVTCLVTGSIIPLILALAVLLFIWGVVQYVISAGNEEQKDKGRQYMIWGIIALTVMVSVWGIVKIVGNTFGITNAVIPQVQNQ